MRPSPFRSLFAQTSGPQRPDNSVQDNRAALLNTASEVIAHNCAMCSHGNMRALTIADSANIILGLQDEIRRSEESRYDHRLHGVLLRSEEHTSELQSLRHLVCRLLLEK